MSSQGSESFGPTGNQLDLERFKDRFARSSPLASHFLEFLRRSGVGVWRVQADDTPSRWWINITLPSHQQEVFGLHREIQVLYTEFEHVEPRALSLLQNRVRKDMRVEPDLSILVSRDKTAKHTAARRAGEMAIISIDLNDLQGESSPLLHTLVARSVSTIDHFDVSTPVRDPSGFYGRQAEAETIAHDLRRAISVGVFGLRKAGKTSLLNSLASRRADDDLNATVRLDVSEIVTAEQFRSAILEDLWTAVSALPGNADLHPRLKSLTRQGLRREDLADSAPVWIQDIRSLLEHASRPVVLIIDEIDQAFPPRSNLEPAEAQGLFGALVQLRSLLQEQDKLVLLCAGVDPALFERPVIEGKDNLLYKLVRLVWLAPMNRDETADMVRSLGKRMGVRARDHLVIDALYAEYGGHPLLTRKACSIAVRGRTAETLPFHLTSEVLEKAMASTEYGGPREQAADIVTSFTEWFPSEAALLRLYFSADAEERELSRSLLKDDPEGMSHAVTYGLCFPDRTARIAAALESLEH